MSSLFSSSLMYRISDESSSVGRTASLCRSLVLSRSFSSSLLNLVTSVWHSSYRFLSTLACPTRLRCSASFGSPLLTADLTLARLLRSFLFSLFANNMVSLFCFMVHWLAS